MVTNNNFSPKIGDVYMMQFHGSGSAQNGLRPGVIIQNNVGNAYSPNVIAIPFTSRIKKTNQPTHVYVSSSESGLMKDSIALCENPESVSKEDVGKFVTSLNSDVMKRIAEAHLVATSVISFVDIESILRICKVAHKLNNN